MDYFECGKNRDLIPPNPPLGPKYWENVDIFDIVAPPLMITKTGTKSYLTVALGLFQPNMYTIFPIVQQYLTLHPYIIIIKAIF